MGNHQIINVDAASEITGGDKELFCMLLDLFIEIAPAQFNRIKKAYADNNTGELIAAAHDIKSSASSFAGEILYNSALVLEENVKNNLDLNSISFMIKDIDENIQSTISLYKSLSWESEFKEEL